MRHPAVRVWRAGGASAALIGLAAVAVLAVVARTVLPLGGLFVLKAMGVFGAVMGIASAARLRHHPFARFGPANQVTTARAVVVALVAACVGEPALPAIAATAGIGGLLMTMLDGVDGWLARRTGLASRFGARFDMEVDALLLMVLALLVWQHDKAGVWVLLSGLLRYLFVAAGWLRGWLARPLPPRVRRQTICVVQTAALLLALFPPVTPPVSGIVAGVALSALCWSFLVDVVWLWRQDGSDQGKADPSKADLKVGLYVRS